MRRSQQVRQRPNKPYEPPALTNTIAFGFLKIAKDAIGRSRWARFSTHPGPLSWCDTPMAKHLTMSRAVDMPRYQSRYFFAEIDVRCLPGTDTLPLIGSFPGRGPLVGDFVRKQLQLCFPLYLSTTSIPELLLMDPAEDRTGSHKKHYSRENLGESCLVRGKSVEWTPLGCSSRRQRCMRNCREGRSAGGPGTITLRVDAVRNVRSMLPALHVLRASSRQEQRERGD